MKTIYKKIRSLVIALALIGTCTKGKAQLSGSYSVPGSYASISAIISDLNTNGVSGPVIINITAGYTETVTAGGFTLNAIAGASSINQITFQKSGAGANPVLYAYSGGTATPSSAMQDGIWRLSGADYIAIDGIDLTDNNIANPATMEFGYGFFKASATDGCQNNTIRNCVITLNRINNATGAGTALDGSRGIDLVNAAASTHTTALTVTSVAGANSNNKFYSNTIQNCNTGIALVGYAAASPFNLADAGNDVGGVSASTGNTIINFGGGGTGNGASGIQTLAQYGINVSNNLINNNNGSGAGHTAALRGIFVNTATSANTTISSNTITLQSIGTSALLTAIQNVSGSTAASNIVTISNNLITGCTYTSATSGVFTGIVNSASPSVLNIVNNTLSNNSTAAMSGAHLLINNSGSVASAININSNSVNGFTFTSAVGGVLNHISNTGGTGSTVLSISSNSIQGIVHLSASSTAHSFIRNTSATLSQTINNNRFINLNLNTTGNVIFIENNQALPAGGSANTNNNAIVTGFTKGGAGGTVTLYLTSTAPASAQGTLKSAQNNNFSNITLTGATTMAGWTDLEGAAGGGSIKTIANNTFTNWACGSSAVFCIQTNSSFNGTSISSNTISNISGSGFIIGISTGGSNGGAVFTVANNIISGFNSTFPGAAVVGITGGSGSVVNLNVTGNTINGLSTVGASSANGINITVGTTVNIRKNKIYNIQSNNAGGTVNGMALSGAIFNVSNNLVGDLRAPASNGDLVLTGMNFGSGTSNVYHNTIHLNATSSSTLFGSAAINVFTGSNQTLNNNLLFNTSVANGAGITAAYRRNSATLSTYLAASNNNLFYTGTPSASSVIYYDGTTTYQTLAAFKTLLGGRDLMSVTENPPFLSISGNSANFLAVNPAVGTQVESGGTPLVAVPDDFAGTVRNPATPDIGAWEGNYTLSDLTPPLLLGSGFTTPACILSGRTFTANLFDISSVAGASLAPRLYYKLNAGAYTSSPGVLTSGTATNGVWTFNMVYSGSLNDVISYYIASEDMATVPNLGASPSTGFAGVDVNNVTTPPTTPDTYGINTLNGIYTVGSTGTFTSLTAAASAYNTYCISGPVTFSLTDALYSTAETFPIVFKNNLQASATNSLLVMPATGTAVLITPTAALLPAVIKFQDARYISFDGFNGLGSSLTLSNSPASAAVANFWLASSNLTGSGSQFISISNMEIHGQSNTSSSGIIASVDGLIPSTTGGSDIDNISVSGNTFVTSYNGILANGTASISAGGLDNWTVSNNQFGPASPGAGNIGGTGCYLNNAVGASVVSNTVQNMNSTSSGGLVLANATSFSVMANTLQNFTTNVVAGGIVANSATNFVISGNTLQNASGFAAGGGIVATSASGFSITSNTVQNFTTSAGDYYGVNITANSSGFSVEQNSMSVLVSLGSSGGVSAIAGLYLGSNVINGTVKANVISTIYNANALGYGAKGLIVNSGNATSNLNIVNNFISDIYCYIDAGTVYWPMGIDVEGTTGGLNIDFNSIHLFGTHTGYTSPGASAGTGIAALYIGGAAGNINIRNNILVNTYDNSTYATDFNYALYSAVSATNFASIDYNNYYVGGTGNNPTLGYLGSNQANLYALQNGFGFGKNLNSLNFEPQFTSDTDLHLMTTSINNAGLDNTAMALAGITSDVDNQSRSLSPDIGADEFTSTAPCVAADGGTIVPSSYSICSTQTLLITATNISSGVGTTYNWKASPTPGGSYTTIATGTGTGSPTYFSQLSPGVYYMVLEASCSNGGLTGISSEATVTVISPPNTNIISSPSVVCQGNSATLTATGATSYLWSTGSTASSIVITPTTTTAYTLTGTNICSVTTTISIPFSVNPTVTISSASPTVCSNAQATLTASGANSYSWSNGATTAVITPTQASNISYSVVGTNTSGCTSALVASPVAVIPSPTVIINGTSGMCAGQTVSLTALGATSFSWSTSAITNTMVDMPITNTVYVVTGSDPNGCFEVASQSVAVIASLSISITGPSTICVGQTASLTANGGVTYTWSTTDVSSIISPSPIITTSYSVVGAFGTCTNAAMMTLTVNPNPTVTVTGNTLVCPGISTTLNALGANTYSWSNSATTSSVVVAPMASTIYTIVGTSLEGCSTATTVPVNTNTVPILSVVRSASAVCVSLPVTFTASGADTYTWSGGGPNTDTFTTSPAAPAVYTVSGTNAAGCVSSATTNIGIYALPVLTISPASATVCALSPVNFTASGANTYTWNGTIVSPVATFVLVNSGTQTVVGTSVNGCVSSKTVAIITNTLPIVSVLPATTTVCALSELTFSASGTANYLWVNNGLASPTATYYPNATTVYTVIGTSAQGCSTSATATAVVNPLPLITVSPAFTTVCISIPTTFTALGAVSYTWNNNAAITGSTAALSTSVATVHTVSGTGANGCVGQLPFVVATYPSPTLNISASSGTVCSLAPVHFTATGAASYTWSNNFVGDSVIVNPTTNPTTYTVNGTDAVTGCIGSQTIAVATNSLPAVAITPASTTVCVNTPVTFSASGGTSYAWNTGWNYANISITPTASTAYTVIATNAQGCVNSATVQLTTNPLPVLVITPSSVTICSGETASLSVIGANNYTWSPGNLNTPSVALTPTVVTFYTVLGVDNNGCKNTKTALVSVNSCTGIKMNTNNPSLSIFPNPSTGVFTVKFGFGGSKTVLVTNAVGQLITQMVTANDEEHIDLSGFTKGIYFVMISSQEVSGNYKVIIH